MLLTRSSSLCVVGLLVLVACSVDGVYVLPDMTPQQFSLSVDVGGSASGVITSEPNGLRCDGGACSQSFPAGSQVELIASSGAGVFLGWSEACTGFATCVVTMDADKRVGALFGRPGQALWVQHGGSTGDDIARAIASDSNGDIVVGGEFRGTIQLGAFMLTSAGGSDAFIAKLAAATGAVIWAKRFGGPGDDLVGAVAIDDAGATYATGTFNGTIDLGGGPLASAGNTDVFALKLDALGAYAWATKIGGAGFDSGRAIAVRGAQVVVVGSFQGTMVVNGSAYTSAGGDDLYITVFDAGGAIRWMKGLGGAGSDVAEGVAIDGSGNVVAVGRFSGTTNLGGSAMVSVRYDDVFVAKYAAATGAHLFSRSFGSTYFDRARAVAVDSSDNIIIAGVYGATIDFGGPAPFTTTGVDLFVLKLSLAGAYLWANVSAGGGFIVDRTATSIATNAAGQVAVSGDFCGTISLGGAPLSSVRSCSDFDRDIFVARYQGADGAHLDSIRAGGTRLEFGWGVAHLPDGRTFVAGGFQGFAEFGGEGLTSNGEYDIVVLGLAPAQ